MLGTPASEHSASLPPESPPPGERALRHPGVCDQCPLGGGRSGLTLRTMRPLPPLHPAGRISVPFRSEAGYGPSLCRRRKPSVPRAARKWQGGAGRGGEQLLGIGEYKEINRLSRPWKPEWLPILTTPGCLFPNGIDPPPPPPPLPRVWMWVSGSPWAFLVLSAK